MLDFIIKALIFIVMLGLIVVVHEGGHFLVGRKNGIAVKEFAMGFGPKIFGRKVGDTMITINALPFGGACIFEGMDGSADESRDDLFEKASIFARISTIFAGPFFNFILAFILSIMVIGCIGYDEPQIAGVLEGYPAHQAGLQAGDIIKSIGGRRIISYRDISSYTFYFEEKTTEVVYERNGKDYTAILTPLYDESEDRYLFGIAGSMGRKKVNPLRVVRYAFHEVYYWIDISYKSIGMMFQGRVTGDDVAGPVGVAQVVGETYDHAKPDGAYYIWLNMLNLTILISANLGVMNLLPLPALDGGRLIFLFIELVTRKRVDPEKEAMVHFAGIIVLIIIMFLVMFNDIGKFFR